VGTDDTSTCRNCGSSFEPAPAVAGLCPRCREAQFPPISMRGGKWSPLALGVTSIFCDILMIPSIMAIFRGISELRQASQRERAGFYSDEHASVRTGAVWGIFLGGLRPMILVFIVATAMLGIFDEPRGSHVPMPEPDEVGEVLALLRSDDAGDQDVALRQLLAVVDNPDELHRALTAVEDGLGHDAETERRLRSFVVMLADDSVTTERLVANFPHVDAEARSFILGHIARHGGDAALSRIPELVASAPEVEVPWETLAESAYPDAFVPGLITLPEARGVRNDAILLAARTCFDRTLGPHGLVPVRELLLEVWAQRRDALLRMGRPASLGARLEGEWPDAIDRAADTVHALGCADAAPALHEALAIGEPALGAGAALALLRNERSVPDAAIARIAADPIVRGWFVRDMSELDPERIPRAYRTTRAVAASDLLADTDATALRRVEWVEDVYTAERELVHVFRVDRDGLAAMYAAIGPYREDGPLPEDWHLEWRRAEEWTDAAPAELARAVVDFHRAQLVQEDEQPVDDDLELEQMNELLESFEEEAP
jgi:hypothetical protein